MITHLPLLAYINFLVLKLVTLYFNPYSLHTTKPIPCGYFIQAPRRSCLQKIMIFSEVSNNSSCIEISMELPVGERDCGHISRHIAKSPTIPSFVRLIQRNLHFSCFMYSDRPYWVVFGDNYIMEACQK